MTRKRRHLSPEDRALWEGVARSVDPLRRPNPPPKLTPKPAPESKPAKKAAEPVSPFRVGSNVDHSRDHDLMRGISEQLGQGPLQMDSKTGRKLKRGKLRPEGRLDLHGMTLAEAHPVLQSFIFGAHQNGKRLVMVITGKGKHRDATGPIPQRLGVLRHQVPHWLRMPPLGPMVLDVTPAHVSHGGHGAYYVYLRRRR